MLQEQRNQVYDTTQDTQTQVQAFSHIKKDQYLTKVFCWIGTQLIISIGLECSSGYFWYLSDILGQVKKLSIFLPIQQKSAYIEQGQTGNIIRFYNTYPHLINNLYTPNHWNPLMYAVRYGNIELIQFLFEKGMKPYVQGIYNHVSIIHSAVYSGQVPILSYVLNNVYKNANPTNCQTSPLKIAMKTGNPKMVELLIAKGAYYTFGDVLNNLLPKQLLAEESSKYTTIDTAKEVSNALVVEDITIKDCPIKETLRWARIRQAMLMKNYAQKMAENNKRFSLHQQVRIKEQEPDQPIQKIVEQQQPQKIQEQKQIPNPIYIPHHQLLNEKHKFYGLSKILLNDDFYNSILRVLVNKGDSILIKNDPVEQKEIKQQKDGPQPQPNQQKK